ncbi:MAG: hypothetical protein AUH30_11600 [Candidatus Rokubacteria bacterium 13_1_40CM_68_15]|nr:MAG: hypothetical protein AUH30_11600 [Candidatus Rokubacteria bacterium 13_1_40CM_68_15]
MTSINVNDDDEPICPVCVEPIEKDDRVSGHRDALLHARCDYVKEYPFQPPQRTERMRRPPRRPLR